MIQSALYISTAVDDHCLHGPDMTCPFIYVCLCNICSSILEDYTCTHNLNFYIYSLAAFFQDNLQDMHNHHAIIHNLSLQDSCKTACKTIYIQNKHLEKLCKTTSQSCKFTISCKTSCKKLARL